MVVLAASILHKNSGKVLFSRQFLPITKVRIDSLLQTFPKLIDEDSQHTFIETDQVRYVYQATEKLYVLLITNKSSNIMEDLDSLQLILKLVPDVAGSLSPEDILLKSFELVFALDEAFSLGMKEYTTLHQINTATEMYSHAEEIHRMLKESQISSAKRLAKERAEELELSRQLRAETGEGLALESSDHFSSEQANQLEQQQEAEMEQEKERRTGGMGIQTYDETGYPGAAAARATAAYNATMASAGMSGMSASASTSTATSDVAVLPKRAVKGLSLMKASRKTDDFVAQLKEEEKLEEAPLPVVSLQTTAVDPALLAAQAAASAAAEAQVPTSTKTTITIEEKVALTLVRDGTCEGFDVECGLKLSVFDPDESKIALKLASPLTSAWKGQLKPGMDRARFAENVLVQSDTTKSFPLGSEASTVLARWRGSMASGLAPPFNVNVWATTAQNRTSVSAEIFCETTNVSLRDVQVFFKHRGLKNTIEIKDISASNTLFDGSYLVWHIPQLDAVKNGHASIEFVMEAIPDEELFPAPVQFGAETAFSGVSVASIVNVETATEVQFDQKVIVRADKVFIK